MKRESQHGRTVGLVVPLLVAALTIGIVRAQPPESPPAGKAADKPSAESSAPAPGAKQRKKPRGRLPAYYGKVVTEKQREEIYQIQAKFNAQIAKLQQQLEELIARRDSDVKNVLSAEQQAEVDRLRAQRRSRRSASRASSSESGSGKATKG